MPLTATIEYPVHVRHDPDGHGELCYEFTGRSTRDYTPDIERCVRDGYDVHRPADCPNRDGAR